MATDRIRHPQRRPAQGWAGGAVRPAARGRSLVRRRLLLVALLCLGVWPLLGWVLAQLLIVKSELAPADAIVVLSGSSTYMERTDWAAKLYHAGRSPLIILTDDKLLSGWHSADERNPYFYELALRELRKRGVPAERILVIREPALGTYYESLSVREYATSHDLKRLLIVTSAYHSRRAFWSMRRACEGSGIEIGVDGPPPGLQTPSPAWWWLRKTGWRVVAGEYVKLVYYRLVY